LGRGDRRAAQGSARARCPRRGRRERLDRRARFKIASARPPVEHVAPLPGPQSLPHPSPQRLTQQRLTGFGPWNRRHRGIAQRLTGRRLTLSVVPRRLVVGTSYRQATPPPAARVLRRPGREEAPEPLPAGDVHAVVRHGWLQSLLPVLPGLGHLATTMPPPAVGSGTGCLASASSPSPT
jgi:hypothetical protein